MKWILFPDLFSFFRRRKRTVKFHTVVSGEEFIRSLQKIIKKYNRGCPKICEKSLVVSVLREDGTEYPVVSLYYDDFYWIVDFKGQAERVSRRWKDNYTVLQCPLTDFYPGDVLCYKDGGVKYEKKAEGFSVSLVKIGE